MYYKRLTIYKVTIKRTFMFFFLPNSGGESAEVGGELRRNTSNNGFDVDRSPFDTHVCSRSLLTLFTIRVCAIAASTGLAQTQPRSASDCHCLGFRV
jgi:hypothetical protein